MRPVAIARRALLAATALIAIIVPVAPAQAPAAPAQRFAVSSAGMHAAQAVARAHWGVDPCGGELEIAWVALEPQVNGISSWTAFGGGYGDAETNEDCRIELNTKMAFSWAKFCTVLVHEYGHLAGHDHEGRSGQLMSAVYARPLAACAARGTRRARASLRWAPLHRAG